MNNPFQMYTLLRRLSNEHRPWQFSNYNKINTTNSANQFLVSKLLIFTEERATQWYPESQTFQSCLSTIQ